MRTARYRLATAAALAVVATSLFTTEAAALRCAATSGGITVMPWSADVRTAEDGGSIIPYGQQDLDWWVVPTDGPTYSVAPHPSWTATIPNANWINSTRTYDSNPATGTGGLRDVLDRVGVALPFVTTQTTFRTTFQVPANSFLAQLDLQYAADNGVTFFLNGVPIGGYDPVPTEPSAFQQVRTLTWAGTFKDGANTLDAVVSDDGVATGLLVGGTATACAPGKVPPGTCVYATPTGLVTFSPKPINLGTGETNHVPHAFTTPDDDWYVHPAGTDAYSVAPHPTAWVTSTTANWINIATTRASGPPTTRTFAVQFTVPAGYTYADLDLRFAVDNTVELYLNAIALSNRIGFHLVPDQTAFNQFHPLLHVGQHFTAGTNTLYAVVRDYGGSTGLIVEGGARICARTPHG